MVTITSYGKDIEPNVPEKNKVIEAFKILSSRVGKEAIGWRYDPIFYGNGFNFERHIAEFENLASALKDYTDSCVLSFLDLYMKVQRNALNIYPSDIEEQKALCQKFTDIAKANGMTVKTCCGSERKWQCMNVRIRARSNCLLGSDIGAYDSCRHLCRYCYANMDKERVLKNMQQHDPMSPFLIGNSQPGDKVTEAKQKNCRVKQISLFE